MLTKRFTKVVALVVVMGFIMSMLAACGSQPSAPKEAAAGTNAAQSTAPKAEEKASADSAKSGSTEKSIVYSNKSLGYYFFVVCQESVKRTAEAAGFKFDAAIAEFDSAKQTSQFMNFVAQKPAAIVTDPIDSEGLIDAINKADAAGIPVAVIDTPTSGGKVAVTVAFDNKIAGIMAAQEIVKRLKEKYGEEKGLVVNIYGAMSSWAWRLRKEGFEEEIKKHPKITYLDVPGEGDMTKTHDALVNILAKYPNIDAVHCPSDTPARGMAEALKQKNKWFKSGEKDHVIFVTIDGEPIANQMIAEGYYDASIAQDAVSYGKIAVNLLNKYTFKGEKVPFGKYADSSYYWKECEIKDSPSGPYVAVPPYVIDSTNANDAKHWGNMAAKDWGLVYK